MVTRWEQIQTLSKNASDSAGVLRIEANKTRCPFALVLANDQPLGVWDEFRCTRDRHEGDDHQLAATAWKEF